MAIWGSGISCFLFDNNRGWGTIGLTGLIGRNVGGDCIKGTGWFGINPGNRGRWMNSWFWTGNPKLFSNPWGIEDDDRLVRTIKDVRQKINFCFAIWLRLLFLLREKVNNREHSEFNVYFEEGSKFWTSLKTAPVCYKGLLIITGVFYSCLNRHVILGDTIEKENQ